MIQLIYWCPPIFGNKHYKYKIKKGNNLTRISNRYKIPITQILKINNLKSKDKIFVGQILKIPKKKHTKFKKKYYHTPYFRYPVKKRRVIKRFDLKGQERTPGVIWRLKKNDHIRSTSSGRVIAIGHLRGYGRYLIINHGHGWASLYSNLSKILVHKNQKILNYQKIAIAKNKKLFFSISYKGKPLNPMPLLKLKSKILELS